MRDPRPERRAAAPRRCVNASRPSPHVSDSSARVPSTLSSARRQFTFTSAPSGVTSPRPVTTTRPGTRRPPARVRRMSSAPSSTRDARDARETSRAIESISTHRFARAHRLARRQRRETRARDVTSIRQFDTLRRRRTPIAMFTAAPSRRADARRCVLSLARWTLERARARRLARWRTSMNKRLSSSVAPDSSVARVRASVRARVRGDVRV